MPGKEDDALFAAGTLRRARVTCDRHGPSGPRSTIWSYDTSAARRAQILMTRRSRPPMQLDDHDRGTGRSHLERWRQLARTVEDAGYAGCSLGPPHRAVRRAECSSLDVWASLTWLGQQHPAAALRAARVSADLLSPGLRLAKRAAAVADLVGRPPRPRRWRRLARGRARHVRHPLPAGEGAHGPTASARRA